MSFNMVTVIINIISIIISTGNIIISIYINSIEQPLTISIEDIQINNSFDLLIKTDNKERNEVLIKFTNYNIHDILVCLQEGYISIKNKENNIVEKHCIKEQYFTLKANSISDIAVKFDIESMNDQTANNRVSLTFRYYNGLRMKKYVYKK